MCGIVGYISKYPKAQERAREKFLIEGLVMDTLRGWDSTGLIWVDDEFTVGTMRNTQPGPQFVRNKKFVETDTNGWAAIGHNRAATRGSVKVGNAHPFRFGPVALVHNGTLRGWKTGLPAQNDKIEVDSAMVAYNLSLVGPDEVDKVLKTVEGDFAFVWTDSRDQSINFVRNHGRPLHMAESRNKNIMYFMSEAGMLRSLSDRQRDAGAKIDTVFKLDTFKHLKFKKGSLVPEVREITPFVRKPQSNVSRTSGRSLPRHTGNDANEKYWSDAVRTTGKRTKNTSAASGAVDVLPYRGSDDMVSRFGKWMQPPKAALTALEQMYQLNPHTRMSFVPGEYVPWDEDYGMVRGMFKHPGWGDTEWEGVVYGFPSAWLADHRFKKEWEVSPCGLAPAWYGDSQKTMPPVMLFVRNFEWVELEDEIPFDVPDEGDTESKELFFGPDDKLIFREHIESLLQYGCSYCQCNLTADDHEDIEWVGMAGDQPLCLDCQNIFTDPDSKHIDNGEEVIH